VLIRVAQRDDDKSYL